MSDLIQILEEVFFDGRKRSTATKWNFLGQGMEEPSSWKFAL
jgi:hypothetical protein